MNHITAVRFRTLPVALLIETETSVPAVASLPRSTKQPPLKVRGGTVLQDGYSHQDQYEVRAGDYLVRIGDNVDVYDAKAFQDTFVMR